jgi:hypothetical protein
VERAVSRRRRLIAIIGAVALAAMLAVDAGSVPAAPSIEETPEPPSISKESASNISATDATLAAVVDDHGLAAAYRFQIAKSPACLPPRPPITAACAKTETGNLPQGSLPPGEGPQSVSLDVNTAGIELEPGAYYHFRLIASSAGGPAWGTEGSFITQQRLTKVQILLPASPEMEMEGGISPRTLPKRTRRPVTLTLNGRVQPGTGERPLGFQAMALEFDKDGAFFTKGLPTCTPLGPGVEPAPGDRHRCDDALVGRGKAYFDIEPPEQPAFGVAAPLEIYNGRPRDGHPVLLYKIYAHVPAATIYLFSAAIEGAHGKFGAKTTIRIPKIVSGHGALIGFRARIGKTWTYGGRKVGLLNARCSRGNLAMRADVELTDGTYTTGELTAPCTPKRQS